MPSSSQKRKDNTNADEMSKGFAEMSIDNGYDKFDAFDSKSVLSRFSIHTSTRRAVAPNTHVRVPHAKALSCSLRLPYRIHHWRDAQLRGRTSLIIHMLSGKSALQMQIGLLQGDHSTLALGHLYSPYMMDKKKAIYEPAFAGDMFSKTNDPTGALSDKLSAVLDNHPRTIAFDKDVARMMHNKPAHFEFKEEMHIPLGCPHDSHFVTYEEDSLFYGCYIGKDPVDKAKFLRIELKEKSKETESHLAPGLESDAISIRCYQPIDATQRAGGFRTPKSNKSLPEQISFNKGDSNSTICEESESSDEDESDDEWENKSFTTSKTSGSQFSFGTNASGKKKKKLKISTGHQSSKSKKSSSSSRKSVSHMMSLTAGKTRTPPPASHTIMMTPQSQQNSHASKKRGAMSSLKQAAIELKYQEKKED